MNSSLSIIAMDNHPLHLQGLTYYFKSLPYVKSVSHCMTYADLMTMMKQQLPDLLFLELNLGSTKYDGFTICRELSSQYKGISIAILSRYNAPHFVRFAKECGAIAYFDKQADVSFLAEFIRVLPTTKDSYYHVHVTPNNGAESSFQSEPFELRYALTPMECRVMKLIVTGKEHGEIEDALSISYETFKTHRQHIFQKLHVRNEVELTQLALTYHLDDMDCAALPSYKSMKSKGVTNL